mgnify:CR=1 FL=1
MFRIFSWLIFISQISLGSSYSKRIIGSNNLAPVENHFENFTVIASIGRMKKGCTATHIGSGLVITAGHCILSTKKTLIGNRPFFYKLNQIEGHDINTKYEFEFAKYLFKNKN